MLRDSYSWWLLEYKRRKKNQLLGSARLAHMEEQSRQKEQVGVKTSGKKMMAKELDFYWVFCLVRKKDEIELDCLMGMVLDFLRVEGWGI